MSYLACIGSLMLSKTFMYVILCILQSSFIFTILVDSGNIL